MWRVSTQANEGVYETATLTGTSAIIGIDATAATTTDRAKSSVFCAATAVDSMKRKACTERETMRSTFFQVARRPIKAWLRNDRDLLHCHGRCD